MFRQEGGSQVEDRRWYLQDRTWEAAMIQSDIGTRGGDSRPPTVIGREHSKPRTGGWFPCSGRRGTAMWWTGYGTSKTKEMIQSDVDTGAATVDHQQQKQLKSNHRKRTVERRDGSAWWRTW